jgi:1-acyl-sn-glycerol-3-phosphate acyltransferase
MKDLIRTLLVALGRALAGMLGGLRAEGLENVPKKGALLLVANHLCDIDAPALWVALPRRAWFMAMSELFEIPYLAPFIRYLQAFPIRRDSPDRAALRFAEERLAEGEAVVVFPEGRGNPEAVMALFQPGAALLALRTGAPVVPVGIAGTHGMLTYGTVFPKRALEPVRIRFGAPLRFDDLSGVPRKEALEEATRRMEAAVARLAGQPVPVRTPELRAAEIAQGLSGSTVK